MNDSEWKVWLQENKLTEEDNYYAEISTAGKTAYTEDIARAIKAAGSELQLETLVDVLNHADRVRRDTLRQGCSVQTGVAHIAPRVRGVWTGDDRAFDPARHSLGFDLSATAELRAALDGVGVLVLGMKDSGAYIGSVTDLSSGRADDTVTRGEDMSLSGARLKVAPDDDGECGVFFVDGAGEATRIGHRYAENMPKRIIAQVPPDLEAGAYTLRVVTRYMHGKQLLRDTRVIDYRKTLTVT
ncbi:DNA-binding domain-containing protein [Treponema endosymbiont of Eucomonympha sp.]|uniref:DNA-binding domain-containing protein n=1 Tax=Treponema endosymbiont of Eucomonympha sp. TaxID=1580831 RepID=UPI000751A801|nr:DNA-binding domain-containing protein [Treponema endosymbiont of Eucomonympha sp.]